MTGNSSPESPFHFVGSYDFGVGPGLNPAEFAELFGDTPFDLESHSGSRGAPLIPAPAPAVHESKTSAAASSSKKRKAVAPISEGDDDDDDDESQAQYTGGNTMERKLKNRVYAKNARQKKKNFISSLENNLKEMAAENLILRNYLSSTAKVNPNDIIKNAMDSASNSLRNMGSKDSGRSSRATRNSQASVDAEAATSGAPAPSSISSLPVPVNALDLLFLKSLETKNQCFVISNPKLPDDPIIYVSDNFCTMTGYSKEEVLGRNCRFLQGSDTDRVAVREMKKQINDGKHIVTCIRNYKKNGTPFWNYLCITPIKDGSNDIVMNVGVQYEVPDKVTSKVTA
jgi:PAS domain S-box-containing protein